MNFPPKQILSPEEEFLNAVDLQENLEFYRDILLKIFGDIDTIRIWGCRYLLSASIRKLAMTFHMSRYHIRRHLKTGNSKVGNVFSL